jgi:hypothetical protein
MTVSLIWTGAAKVGLLRKGEQQRKRVRAALAKREALELERVHRIRVGYLWNSRLKELPSRLGDATRQAGLTPVAVATRNDPLDMLDHVILKVKNRRKTTSLELLRKVPGVAYAEWMDGPA